MTEAVPANVSRHGGGFPESVPAIRLLLALLTTWQWEDQPARIARLADVAVLGQPLQRMGWMCASRPWSVASRRPTAVTPTVSFSRAKRVREESSAFREARRRHRARGRLPGPAPQDPRHATYPAAGRHGASSSTSIPRFGVPSTIASAPFSTTAPGSDRSCGTATVTRICTRTSKVRWPGLVTFSPGGDPSWKRRSGASNGRRARSGIRTNRCATIPAAHRPRRRAERLPGESAGTGHENLVARDGCPFARTATPTSAPVVLRPPAARGAGSCGADVTDGTIEDRNKMRFVS